jgi:archaellum component FlaC
MDSDRLDALSEVIDMIEDTLGKLSKMDIDFGLTEAQYYTQKVLQQEYEDLSADYTSIEKEYINYEY